MCQLRGGTIRGASQGGMSMQGFFFRWVQDADEKSELKTTVDN